MMLQALATAPRVSTRPPARPRPLSPSDYALRYHNLAVNDGNQGLFETVNVTRYQNGPRGETTTEYSSLIGAIKKVLGVKHLPNPFSFPAGDVMNAAEWFFLPGIRRAFNGKGSPAEIADVLRLAFRCGRIGKKTSNPTLTVYAERFLGLDCNGLVGNYFGLSPAVSISVWALGEPAKLMQWDHDKLLASGWGPAEVATAPYVPLTPIRSAPDVRSGDVLITVTPEGKYKHIAMVDKVNLLADGRVHWTIVEWGQGGNVANHIRKESDITLVKGSKKNHGLGIVSGENFRYLFAAPDTPFESANWGRCGDETI